MSRFRSSGSYGHTIRRLGPDDFRLHWHVDRYYPDSRQRHPRGCSRDTDRKGAERFAKRWKCKMPDEPATIDPLTDAPCPRCLALAQEGHLRMETVQRLPAGAYAPLGQDGQKCCFDCASADGLARFEKALNFEMARVAVANDRQEQYRLPGVRMGLVLTGIVRPSKRGDLEQQYAWLTAHNWFGWEDVDG